MTEKENETVNTKNAVLTGKKLIDIKFTKSTLLTLTKFISVFCVIIMISVVFYGWVTRDATSGITGTPLPDSGDDWIISESTTVTSETIIMESNVIITETGDLTLTSSELIMESDASNNYKIEVKSGGELNVYYSNITRGSNGYNYDMFFRPGSSGSLMYSTISYCGYESADSSKGIKIETNDVKIIGNTIRNNYHGINVVKGDPSILNNTIINNIHDGIHWECGISIGNDTYENTLRIESNNNLEIEDGDLIFASNDEYGEYETDTGTAALFHMDEGEKIYVNDSSDNVNQGILGDDSNNKPTWVNAKYNYGLDFDGDDDFVKIFDSSSLDLTDKTTLEAWIYPRDLSLDSQYIFYKGDSSTSCNYMVRTGSGSASERMKMEFGFYNSANTKWLRWKTSNPVLNDINKWYHVAVTYDGSKEPIIFINGIEKSVIWTGDGQEEFLNMEPNNALLYLGKYETNNFDGVMDEVRVSNVIRKSFNVYGGENKVENGVVGLWHINEGVGSTITDETIYSNDGTLGNGGANDKPTWADGKYGFSLKYDEDDGIVIPYDSGNPVFDFQYDDFTIEAWIKTTSTSKQYIVSRIHSVNNDEYGLFIDNNKLNFYIQDNTYTQLVTSLSNVNDGIWHHVAGSVDRSDTSGMMVFIDGVCEAKADPTLVFSIDTPDVPLYIGSKEFGDPDDYFVGKIDEICIRDKFESEYQVSRSEHNLDQGTIALLHLNEDTGSTAYDSSDNDNDGILGTGPSEPKRAPGKFDDSLNFDGNDHVEIPDDDSLDIQDEITVEAWIKAKTGVSYSNSIILSKYIYDISNLDDSFILGFDSTGTTIEFSIFVENTKYYIAHHESVPLDTWTHVKGTYDSTSRTLLVFINGVKTTQGPTPGQPGGSGLIDVSDQPVVIGADSSKSLNYFQGRIDDVRISDTSRVNMDYFHTVGEILTTPVTLPFMSKWMTLELDKYVPDVNNYNLKVTIIDSKTGSSISGYEDIFGTSKDISGIASDKHSSTKLKIEFFGLGVDTAKLHWWKIDGVVSIFGNNISFNKDNGIYLEDASTYILENTFVKNENAAIYVNHVNDDYAVIASNNITASDNSGIGIYLINSYPAIYDNYIHRSSYGVYGENLASDQISEIAKHNILTGKNPSRTVSFSKDNPPVYDSSEKSTNILAPNTKQFTITEASVTLEGHLEEYYGDGWNFEDQKVSGTFQDENEVIDMKENTKPEIAKENGKLYAVWQKLISDGSQQNYDIYYNIYDGEFWEQDDIRVPDLTYGEYPYTIKMNPDIAVENGNIYIVWEDYRAVPHPNSEIYFNWFDSSTQSWGQDNWGQEAKIDHMNDPFIDRKNPSIAVDNGNILITWEQERAPMSGYYDIFYTKKFGGSWDPIDYLVSTNTNIDPHSNHNPEIVGDNDRFYVAWEMFHDITAPTSEIYFCGFDANPYTPGTSGWSQPIQLDGIGDISERHPAAAMDDTYIYFTYEDLMFGMDYDIFLTGFDVTVCDRDGGEFIPEGLWQTFRITEEQIPMINEPVNEMRVYDQVHSTIDVEGDWIYLGWESCDISNPGFLTETYDYNSITPTIYYRGIFDFGCWDPFDVQISSIYKLDPINEYSYHYTPKVAGNGQDEIYMIWDGDILLEEETSNDILFDHYSLNKYIRSPPTDPTFRIESGNEIWYFQGQFYKEETVVITTELNTYLDNFFNSPKMYLEVPLIFTSSSVGELEIKNIRIIYDLDPLQFAFNYIEECDVGLYIVDSDSFTMYSNTLIDNDAGLKIENSIVTSEENTLMNENLDIEMTGETSSTSKLTMVNSSYDDLKLSLDEQDSEIEVQWFLTINMEDTSGNPEANKAFELDDIDFDAQNNLQLSTDNNGKEAYIRLTEVVINRPLSSTSLKRIYYTPHRFTTEDSGVTKNNVGIVMDTSKTVDIIYGDDSDLDLYADKLEFNRKKVFFEAEHHVKHPSQIVDEFEFLTSNDQTIISEPTNNFLINDYFPTGIPNDESTDEHNYRIYIRAKEIAPEEVEKVEYQITIKNADGSTTLVDKESRILAKNYRWFSTEKFYTTDRYLKISIEDLSFPDQYVKLDKIIIVRDNYDSWNWGNLTDPLERDSDYDLLTDGFETREDTYFWEAEDQIANTGVETVEDEEASNGTVVHAQYSNTETNKEVVKFYFDGQDKADDPSPDLTLEDTKEYKFLVRAKRPPWLHDTPEFTIPDDGTPNGKYSIDAAWADVDLDGDLDVALIIQNDPSDFWNRIVKVYRDLGGFFEANPYWTSPQKNTNCIEWGDINNDGYPDLVMGIFTTIPDMARQQDPPHEIYLNNDGILSSTADKVFGASQNTYFMIPTSIEIGNIDTPIGVEQGLDIVIGYWNYDPQSNGKAQTHIYLHDGDGISQNPHWSSPITTMTNDVKLIDVFQDGFLDLLEGNGDAQSSTGPGDYNYVYMNHFPIYQEFGHDNPDPWEPQECPVCGVDDYYWRSPSQLRTSSFALYDIDGDDDLDIAEGNYNDEIIMWENNNNGVTKIDEYLESDNPYTNCLSWGDIEGDGDLDLAVGTGSYSQPNFVLINDKENFYDHVSWESNDNYWTNDINWIDINLDDAMDLTSINFNDDDVIFLNGLDDIKPDIQMELDVFRKILELEDRLVAVPKVVNLNTYSEWYETDVFPVYTEFVEEIILKVKEKNPPHHNGFVWVDKICLVQVDEILYEDFTINDAGLEDKSIQLEYDPVLETYTHTESIEIKIPKDATVISATFEIEGETPVGENVFKVFKGSKNILITPTPSGTATYDETDPDVYNERVVYVNESSESTDSKIYVCDMSGDDFQYYPVTQSGDTYGKQIEPAIWGDYVVWTEEIDYSGTKYYNVRYAELGEAPNVGTPVDISLKENNQRNPAIWNNIIAWEEFVINSESNERSDIWMYNINDQTLTRLNNDNEEGEATAKGDSQKNPSVYEGRIVWDEYDPMPKPSISYAGDKDVFMHDMSASANEYSKEVALTNSHSLITKTLRHQPNRDQTMPVLFGDKIAMKSLNDGLEIYYLSQGYSAMVDNGNIEIGDELDMWGNSIIWHNTKSSTNNIYAYDLVTENVRQLDSAFMGEAEYNPAVFDSKVVWDFDDSENGDSDISFLDQYYNLTIGETPLVWEYDSIFMEPIIVQNFESAINNYMINNPLPPGQDDYYIPLEFFSKYHGALKISNLKVEFECLSDPMDFDSDGDGISDSREFFDFFGYDLIETEDAVEYKEWIYSPINFIHQTGVAITTSYGYVFDEVPIPEDSWIKLRTTAEDTGTFKLLIEPDADRQPIYKNHDVQTLRAYENPPEYYTKPGGDAAYLTSEDIEEYKKYVKEALIFEIRKDGGDEIVPDSEEIDIVIDRIEFGLSTGIEVNPSGDEEGIAIYCYLNYEGIYNLTQGTTYSIKIGLDMLKLHGYFIENNYIVWPNIMLIQILDIDRIRVERQGMNPLKRDSDKDGLSDDYEATPDGFPLNADPDHDGLNDKFEYTVTKTRMDYRDTDLDGIRDGVEVGISAKAISEMNGYESSGGSWMERIAHSLDHTPYNFSAIYNWDADTNLEINPSGEFYTTDPLDTDSDNDGLPDGWTDGWIYDGSVLEDSRTLSYYNMLQYQDIYFYRYSVDKWGRGSTTDNRIQIFEGEDFDCDGRFNWGVNNPEDPNYVQWQFYSDTYEPVSFINDNNPIDGKYTFASETNPATDDSDSDGMPDGYEVWYTITDPIRYETLIDENDPNDPNDNEYGYEYFLNPVEDDWKSDVDLNASKDDLLSSYNGGDDIGNELGNDLVYKYLTKDNEAYGALIDLSGVQHTPSFVPIIGAEVYIDLSSNSDTHVTIEVWDDFKMGETPPTVHADCVPEYMVYSQTVNGNKSGWYNFTIPSSIIAYKGNSDVHDGDEDDKYYEDGDSSTYGKRSPCYFLVVRYVQPDETSASNYDIEVGFQQKTGGIYYSPDSEGNWVKQSSANRELVYRLYVFNNKYDDNKNPLDPDPSVPDTWGDRVANKYEYLMGTNPKLKNTDYFSIGTTKYDDKLVDGAEVGYTPGNLDEDPRAASSRVDHYRPLGGIIFKTNIKFGAIKFDNYGEDPNYYIKYDGDGEGSQIHGYQYDYDSILVNPESKHLVHSEENIELFILEDGTKILMTPDTYINSGSVVPGSTIYVVDPNMIYDGHFDKYTGIVYVFVRDDNGPIVMSNLVPSDFGTELYKSYPFSYDTDLDGIPDGMEINWDMEAEKYDENQAFNTPCDTLINVRDTDSDNDGLIDRMEVGWNDDTDGDDLKNMEDSDSDNDGLIDGKEQKYNFDTDLDGLVNMLDDDSDGDGLKDGEETSPYILHDTGSPATTMYSKLDILDDLALTGPHLMTMDRYENIYFFDYDDSDPPPYYYTLKKLPKGYSVTADPLNIEWNSDNYKNILNITNEPIDLAVDGYGNIHYIEKIGSTYKLNKVMKTYVSYAYDDTAFNDLSNQDLIETLVSSPSTYFNEPSSLKINNNNDILFIDKKNSDYRIIKYKPGFELDGNPYRILIEDTIPELAGQDIKAITESQNGNLFFVTNGQKLFMLPTRYVDWKSNDDNVQDNRDIMRTILEGGIYSTIIDITTDNNGNLYFLDLEDNPHPTPDQNILKMLPEGFFRDYSTWNELSVVTIADTVQEPIGDLTEINDFHVTEKGDIYFISEADDRMVSFPWARTSMVSIDSDKDRLLDGFYKYYTVLPSDYEKILIDKFSRNNIVSIESDNANVDKENYIMENIEGQHRGTLFFGELSNYDIFENKFTTTSPYRDTVHTTVHSNPLSFNTDGDGLSDGTELEGNWLYWSDYIKYENYITNPYQPPFLNEYYIYSDPNRVDSDDDGIADHIEWGFTDPGDQDTDADGIGDSTEDKNKNGELDIGELNPINQDTDGDFLCDGWYDEDNDGVWDFDSPDPDTNYNEYGEHHEFGGATANPLNRDTDDDGVPDGVEFAFLTKRYNGLQSGYRDTDGNGTIDICQVDSDNDGLTDGEENFIANNEIDQNKAANGYTHGLIAEYYDPGTYEKLKGYEIVSDVEMDWSTGKPESVSDADDFKIVYTGYIYVDFEDPLNGYQFRLKGDGKLKLNIAGEEKEITTDSSDSSDTNTITMKFGQGLEYNALDTGLHEVRIEFVETDAGTNKNANLTFEWYMGYITGSNFKTISTEYLYTPFRGLFGEYCDKDFEGTPYSTENTRIDNKPIDFDWGYGAPYGIPNADDFSVRWADRIYIPNEEMISFKIETLGKAYLIIDSTEIITIDTDYDTWSEGSAEYEYTSGLSKGYHDIELKYKEKETSGTAGIKMYWKNSLLTGTGYKLIPPENLFSTTLTSYHGLYGKYYEGDFSGNPVNKRVDDERGIKGPIDYKWYDGNPEGPGIPFSTDLTDKDSFTIEWTGEIYVPYEEPIKIQVEAQGGMRLYIDNDPPVVDWTDSQGSAWDTIEGDYTSSPYLTVGLHTIKVHFKESYFESEAGVRLKWASNSLTGSTSTFEVIPRTYLFTTNEVSALSNNIKYYVETDPSDSDCDNDGLLDGAEPAWKEDNDLDGFINAWDQDSNDQIANPNKDGEYDLNSTSRLDHAQDYVVFRMWGRSGNDFIEFEEVGYGTGSWIAADPNTGNSTSNGVNLYWNEYPDEWSSSETDNPLDLKVFKYDSTGPATGLTEMKVKYGDPYDTQTAPDEESVLTPEGYQVYYKDEDSDPGDYSHAIYIKISSGNYAKYTYFSNYEDPVNHKEENVNSVPDLPEDDVADPDPATNFVYTKQEYYDPRPALNLDSDFDGLENGVEIMFGSNPNDADTDNDGIKDGKELFWNKDTDRDGTWERNLWMGHYESGKWIGNYYNTGINLLDPDSDNDGVPDGTEMGVVKGHPHTYKNVLTYTSYPTLANSNDEMYEYPVIFYDPDHQSSNHPDDPQGHDSQYELDIDQDSGNTTDPLLNDTDGDGLTDGWDDQNGNGIYVTNEYRGEDFQPALAGTFTYVLNYRADEKKDYLCSNGKVETTLTDSDPANDEPDPLDKDSDDDGRYDGDEGKNSGGAVVKYWYLDMDSDGLHNAYDTDSDGDMVYDGVELGYTEANINPDHTNLTVFKADKNPRITTEPLDADSDNDGIYDGYYDEDEDGYYDSSEYGEDTDCDGAIKGDLNNDGVLDLIDPLKDQEPKPGQGESSELWEETHPDDVDSDKDGLYDGFDIIDEVTGLIDEPGELSRHNLAINDKLKPVNQNYYGIDVQGSPTSPVNPDTDGDMLWDWEDITEGGEVIHKGEMDSANLYQTLMKNKLSYRTGWLLSTDPDFTLPEQKLFTDPTIIDTDEDGLIDGIEVMGWKYNVTNGRTLEFMEKYGRQVYSNPREKDTDGDNDDNPDFNLTDFDEWAYQSNASHVDSDSDYIPDWDEDPVNITTTEAEDPVIGDIEGKVTIEWHYADVLGIKIPVYPEEFYLELSIPVEDNAGLEKIRIWVADKQMPTIYLNGVKKTTVKATYHASAFKAIFNGYDVEANLTDVNGNYKSGEAHIDGALEGILAIILSFLLVAILLALAFLGSWIIPIIMAACAITIVISVAVIITNWNEWTNNVKKAIQIQGQNMESGGEVDFSAVFNAIFDSKMIIAFTALFIAIDVLYLCLKAYLSVGGWVLDSAKSLAMNLVVMVIVGAIASSVSYINDIKNGKGIGEIVFGLLDDKKDGGDTKGNSLDLILGTLGIILDLIALRAASFERQMGGKIGVLLMAIGALTLSSISLLWSIFNLPGGIYTSMVTSIFGICMAVAGLTGAIIGELNKEANIGVSKTIKWFLTLSSVGMATYSVIKFLYEVNENYEDNPP